jgi:hypothetical protein
VAKKRRQKEVKKEDYDFKFPEFDEVKFIKKEFTKAKVAFITAGYAVLFALLSYVLLSMDYENWQVPVIVGFFAVFTLPLLFRQLKIDLEEYELKSWIGAGAIYFFIWLAVFIILCNPPFSDFAEPEIESPTIYVNNPINGTDTWVKLNTTAGIYEISRSNEFNITTNIYDNWNLDENSISIKLIDSSGNSFDYNRTENNNAKYEFIYEKNSLRSGRYDIVIEAEDEAGHLAEYSEAIRII